VTESAIVKDIKVNVNEAVMLEQFYHEDLIFWNFMKKKHESLSPKEVESKSL